MAGKKTQDKRQSGQYDRIWRENMEAALPGIIEKFVRNLIAELGLPDDQIARIAGVTIEFAAEVRASVN